MPAVLLLLGAGLLLGGIALLCWPASIATAGVLMLLAGIDLRR